MTVGMDAQGSMGGANGAGNGEEKKSVRLLVTVHKATNLRGSRGDAISTYARIEFPQKGVADSPVVPETRNPEYKFSHGLDLTLDDQTMNDIASQALAVSILEQLPKERMAVLGTARIDLLPLILQGKTSVQETIVIQAGTDGGEPPAEVTIEAVVPSPLLTEHERKHGGVLTFRSDGLFSVPDAWGGKDASSYAYHLTLQLPGDRSVQLSGGAFSPIPDRVTTLADITTEIGEKFGDVRPEDAAFRLECETTKPRVAWQSVRRCYLPPDAWVRLRHAVIANAQLAVEVSRTPTGKAADPSPQRGLMFITSTAFLTPGTVSLRGAYFVRPFDESELVDKQRPHSRSRDFGEFERSTSRMALPTFPLGTTPMSNMASMASVAMAPPVKKPPNVKGRAEHSEQAHDTRAYLDHRTYALLELSLSLPLVPKRPPVAVRNVADYIPQRAAFPRLGEGAQKALDDYREQVTSIADSLAEEYRSLFPPEGAEPLSMDDRRRKLLFELNTSGKYFAFKEAIKRTIVKIVREKYMRTTEFTDAAERNDFLAELYVLLVDQMHTALGRVFAIESTPAVPVIPEQSDPAALKRFAIEAEVNGKLALAAKYYQERVARNKSNASHWFDYGAFCLRCDDASKAEECLKEALSINQAHFPSLLLYGAVQCANERMDVAETFFRAAVEADPKSVLGLTMLGLYNDLVERDVEAERAFADASKLEKDSAGEDGASSIYMIAATFLLDNGATHFAGRALAHELLAHGTSPKYFLALARLQLMGHDYRAAEASARSCVGPDGPDTEATALLGHVQYLRGDYSDAMVTYERLLGMARPPSDIYAVYLRLADAYVRNGEFERAKDIYLRACKDAPSSGTWLGVGIACLELGDLRQAEDALTEANVLNNGDPDVWGYLALLCVRGDRKFEAERAYHHALKLNLTNSTLRREVDNYLATA